MILIIFYSVDFPVGFIVAHKIVDVVLAVFIDKDLWASCWDFTAEPYHRDTSAGSINGAVMMGYLCRSYRQNMSPVPKKNYGEHDFLESTLMDKMEDLQ